MAESWKCQTVNVASKGDIYQQLSSESVSGVNLEKYDTEKATHTTVKSLRSDGTIKTSWEPETPEPSGALDMDLIDSHHRPRLDSQSSIVDGLLFEIYDRWHDSRRDSYDSDTFTEYSSTSEFPHWRRTADFQDIVVGGRHFGHLHRTMLEEQELDQLKAIRTELQRQANQTSAKLVRQLKRRERRFAKLQANYDILTAVLQASSLKRRIDTRMRFSVDPPPGDSAFEQWKDAMRAVARLPLGIPDEFRKKVWLSMAENHIKDLKIDWDKTARFVFNERSNPDDNKLGMQIVKDLHRTGCSGFSGQDNEEERVLLKRVLLAYARWNKAVGYCQGFNVIAALLLDVMDRQEGDALKVMIYLIDHVLPQSYFANNLRALSVDMAVFRDLLKVFPRLSKHLDYLQHAQDQASGGCYEPPLTNVFTMQWFLTLFATCLPKSTVLRVWDSILLEGSEVLLRTALTIWGKLSNRLLALSSADEFYTVMGDLTQEMLEGRILDADSLIKHVYTLAPFPFPQLMDLREKYTYNIRPFTPNASGAAKKTAWVEGTVLPSDEDDLDDEDIEAITCFTGIIPTATGLRSKGLDSDQRASSVPDISSLGPGAYGLGSGDIQGSGGLPAYMERMTTDISALKKQYEKLKQRQAQAHVILATATAKQNAKVKQMVPTIETPTAVNHLFIAKEGRKGKNNFVAAGPRIASMFPAKPTDSGPHSPSPKKAIQTVLPPLSLSVKCKHIQQQSGIDRGNSIGRRKHGKEKDKSPGVSPRKDKESVVPASKGMESQAKTVEQPAKSKKLDSESSCTAGSISPANTQTTELVNDVCDSGTTAVGPSVDQSETDTISEGQTSQDLKDSKLEQSNLSVQQLQEDDILLMTFTEDSAGDVTEKSAGTVTEKSAGPVTEKSAGAVTEKSAGTVTEKSAGPVTEKSAGAVTEKSAGTVTEKSAGPVTEKSAGAVTENSIGVDGEGEGEAGDDQKANRNCSVAGVDTRTKAVCQDDNCDDSDGAKLSSHEGDGKDTIDQDKDTIDQDKDDISPIGKSKSEYIQSDNKEDYLDVCSSEKQIEVTDNVENKEICETHDYCESQQDDTLPEEGTEGDTGSTASLRKCSSSTEKNCSSENLQQGAENGNINNNNVNTRDMVTSSQDEKQDSGAAADTKPQSTNVTQSYAKSETIERVVDIPKRRCISEIPKMASTSSGSGTDSEGTADVFSDSDSHSRSFNLYYSNKKNMYSKTNSSSIEAHLQKCKLPPRPFNPFPVTHVNQNRARTGVKLGLYTQSRLEEIGKNFKR